MRFHRTIAALSGAAALLVPAAPAGAQATHETDHYSFEVSLPFVAPCDDPPYTGVLTVAGDGVVTFTDTGTSFQLTDNANGLFTVDPDDPSVPSSSGHFVVQHRERLNYDQLKDFRVTDTQHTIVHEIDGTNFPIQVMTTVLFSAEGEIDVKVDTIKCGGQSTG
jgi:hypothetical protein